jgi:hypothetical protein
MFAPSLQWVPARPVPHLPRYYGVIRLLCARPGGLWSPSTTRYPRSRRRRRRGLPGLWEIPLRACPGLGTPAVRREPRVAVPAMRPSVTLTTSASAAWADFGAESTRPAPSLSTLHLVGHPTQVQDSLPACPLRRWPGWICTSWIPLRGFTCSLFVPPLPHFPGAKGQSPWLVS